MPAAISLANFKAHARIYHSADDSYITSILLPAAIEAWERATGVSAQIANRTAKLSEEGDVPFYPYPQPVTPLSPFYTEDGSITLEVPEIHYEGQRQVLIIPEGAARPVSIGWSTGESTEAILPVLELATRLYADRGDSTSAIEGKAAQMLVALMHERPVV
jgi:hypothetical protein